MKLWKKIVLIVSTLIVIVSSMILPVFADSWSNDLGYPNVMPVGAEYKVGLVLEDKLHKRTLQYDLETQVLQPGDDIMTRPSQTLTGRLSANNIRDSEYSTYDQYDLQYQLTLHNRYISLSNPSSSQNGGYYLEYGNIGRATLDNKIGMIEYSNLRLRISNYVWHRSYDRLRPEITLKVPDYGITIPNYVKVTTWITALRPIFNYDDNSISFEPMDIKTEVTYSNRDLYDIRTISIVPNSLETTVKPKIIINGEESTVGSSGYVLIDNIDVSISNAENEEQGLNLTNFGVRLPFNTLDKDALGYYRDVIAPDDYDRYMSAISVTRLKDMSARIETDGFWNFIGDSIGAFFDFEIIPNISIGGIILGIVALLLFIIFLKIFAGG